MTVGWKIELYRKYVELTQIPRQLPFGIVKFGRASGHLEHFSVDKKQASSDVVMWTEKWALFR